MNFLYLNQQFSYFCFQVIFFYFSVDNVPRDVTKDSKDDNDSNINKK